MYQPLHCLTLRTVKYDDRQSIVTVWTAELGRVSLTVPAGASREARRRRALMMPLGLFEGQVDLRPGRELLSIRDVRPTYVASDISANPSKSVVAIFLAEALEKLLRTGAPDPALTDFLTESVRTLDIMPTAIGVANFPVIFLYRLGHFFGILPDAGDWRPGSFFDLREGVYRRSVPLHGHYLEADATAVAAMLDRLTYATGTRLPLPRTLRRQILDTILQYYTLHHTNMDHLNSLPILRDLF